VHQLSDDQKVIDPGAETTSRIVVSRIFLMKRHSAVRLRLYENQKKMKKGAKAP
jgi:hypothetical protein